MRSIGTVCKENITSINSGCYYTTLKIIGKNQEVELIFKINNYGTYSVSCKINNFTSFLGFHDYNNEAIEDLIRNFVNDNVHNIEKLYKYV